MRKFARYTTIVKNLDSFRKKRKVKLVRSVLKSCMQLSDAFISVSIFTSIHSRNKAILKLLCVSNNKGSRDYENNVFFLHITPL